MSDVRFPRTPKLSRRHFLAAASATPALPRTSVGGECVAEQARAWNADWDFIAYLSQRWQVLERDLQRRTRSLDFIAAADKGDVGALEMVAIEERLPGLFHAAEAAAERIAALPSLTLKDALAKLQIALSIIAPHDSEGPSYALLIGGYEDLVRLLGPFTDQ